jgi:hypothetical protein
VASENPVSHGQNAQSGNRQPNEQSGSPKPEVPPSATKLDIPPSPSRCENSHAKKKHWVDYATFILELLGLIALCVYAAYTIGIYHANKEAANAASSAANAATFAAKAAQDQVALMKQQFVGTQAAVVRVADFPSIYRLGNLFNVDLAFINSGHVLARNIRMNVKVTTREVKTGRVVEVLTNCSSQLEVPAPEDKPRKISQPCDFPVISQQWANIPTLKETIAVDGTFSYWDGFEDSGPQEVCLRYVPNGVKTAFGASEGWGRFFSCTEYPGAVAYLKARIAGVEHPERLPQ